MSLYQKSILTFALVSALSACGVTNDQTSDTLRARDGSSGINLVRPENGKIFGENELTYVINNGENIPEKYRSIINAFGKIEMGCTATHIGNGIALTAGHCFKAKEVRENNKPCGSNSDITWGYLKDRGTDGVMKSTCTEILAMQQDDDLDYAIIRVNPIPNEVVEIDRSAKGSEGSPLTIFGYAEGYPLRWSKTCKLMTSIEGKPWPWGNFHFAHTCDTLGGNSGSVVLNDENLKVVGIHDGGLNDRGSNYATHLLDTPVLDFVEGGRPDPRPSPSPTPDQPDSGIEDQTFGPFGNNENKVLYTFDTSAGATVSFDLQTDVERGYDFAIVQDASGRKQKFTGKSSTTLSNLKTPVKVSFTSDKSETSKSVSLRKIQIK